jgi:DNA-binding response OmpR family regulator
VQNILIIDDDPTGTQLLITLLLLDGHHAHELESWKHPLGDVEKDRPSLVIMDVHLQTKNGLELLNQIRAHPNPEVASTPVLMISADDYHLRCQRAGASGFLMKPFDYEELLDIVKKIEEENLSEN